MHDQYEKGLKVINLFLEVTYNTECFHPINQNDQQDFFSLRIEYLLLLSYM